MASLPPLQAVGLIEKDVNGDVMWVWSYPSIDPAFRDLLMKKCTLVDGNETEETPALEYSFGHYAEAWFYMLNQNANEISKVTSFCIVTIAKDFNPEKYEHFAKILCCEYRNSGNPVSMVSYFLRAYTTGEVSPKAAGEEPLEQYRERSYDIRRAYVARSLRDVVQTLGVEIILVYNALLLKKRVAVFAPKLQQLLDFCRTLPLLVWHRQNWNIVYPNTAIEEYELATFQNHATFVAGFSDPSIEARMDLYDLFINVPAGTITVNPEVKESFAMTKLHKDIAMRLMECIRDEEYSDQAVIKELSSKTKELLSNIKKLAGGDDRVSIEQLRAHKLTPATETFLFGVASAEGFAQL